MKPLGSIQTALANHSKKFGFGKEEKLKSRKSIEHLFKNGTRDKEFPLSAIWMLQEQELSGKLKAGFSVPKKLIGKANKRNLLKRRIRESFRLNKQLLYECIDDNKQLQIMFIYMDSELTNYNKIESKLVLLLHKIAASVEKDGRIGT